MTEAASLAGQPADSAYIFVYGGLMRGFDLHHFLAGATFIGEGRTRGTLVSLGRYPGLLAGEGEVRGEIYRIDDAAARLESLDDLEEYDPANPADSAYLRVEQEIRGDDGSVRRAWTYLYNRATAGSPVIASGDWRQTDKRPG